MEVGDIEETRQLIVHQSLVLRPWPDSCSKSLVQNGNLRIFATQETQVKAITPLMILEKLTEGVNLSRKSPMLTLIKVIARRHSGCVTKLILSPFGMFEGGSMYATWRPAPYLTSGMKSIISIKTTNLENVSFSQYYQ